MKSPFPGMDPYIEVSDLWEDFHDDLIASIKRIISEHLPARYVVRTSKRSYIVLVESEEKAERHFIPDVKITAPRSGPGSSAAVSATGPQASMATPEMEPVELRAFIDEEFQENFIDIYELKPERRLVTSIEVLSPSNKRRGSEGWQQYLRKRQALLLGKAHLVEIDLLRGGDRLPMLDPWPTSPYTLLVARQEKAPRCRVWPAFFDRPLPVIPIPLTKPDPDLQLELQPLIAAIFERGRYSEEIDYSRPLPPPLTSEQAAWLKGLLPARKPSTKPRAAPKRRKRD